MSSIGKLGEGVAEVLLLSLISQGIDIRVEKIGGDFPTIDIYAEIDEAGYTYGAWFQVKTTANDITGRDTLQVQVPFEKLKKLSKLLAPTYVIGIHYNEMQPPTSKGYLKFVKGRYTRGWGSISTRYPMDENNLLRLKDDIISFWQGTDVINAKTNFTSTFR